MSNAISIGVQLYSVREDCGRDLPAVIRQIGQMGYQGVEFAGYYNYPAKDLRKLLDDNGLQCCGTHTKLETLLGDNLAATMEFNQVLGNKFLIVPWLPVEKRNSVQVIQETAALFNDLAGKVAPAGMLVGYHAHAVDFELVEGLSSWERFFSLTQPDVVMQMDTGNCAAGKADPVAILRKYPGRSITVHLKEEGGPDGAVIGQGIIPWQQVFDVCRSTAATRWYIVEHETNKTASLQAIRLCLQNLRKMGA